MTTLILPGIGNSGPAHWQTRWEALDPALVRVHQAEWDAPRCADWVATLDAAIAAHDAPVVLVAHSSSCALVAHWVVAATPAAHARVGGALLVGPSDPTGPHYPAGPTGFAPVPLVRLPFPSIVVASTDDRYVAFDVARGYADAWGSRFVDVGAKGHVNGESGLGDWPEGRALLASLTGAR
jgi:predicted alpha/beta hydrolase family esterase